MRQRVTVGGQAMRTTILGFAAGAALLQMQPALPEWPVFAVGLLLALAAYSLRGGWLRTALVFGAGLLLGFGWAAMQARSALADRLDKADEGRDIQLVGTIANLPFRSGDGVRFNFAVEQVVGAAIHVPAKLSLAWYANRGGAVANAPEAFRHAANGAAARGTTAFGDGGAFGDVQPGERWQLTVRLQRPHGNANPYGFDYEVWLLEQGLRATGYVRASSSNRRLDSFVPGFDHVVEHCRAVLRDRIERALPGKEYAGVIVALVVGDQRGIPQSDWKVFNRTGIGHLISISGLHITMVAGLFSLAVSALWRRSFFTRCQLPLILPAQKVAALTGACVALLYVLLAGFGVPAQRTLYMLAVVAVALWLDRIACVSYVLCAALGVVVLLDPWAVLWPGFWLSFGAVAVILYATVGRTVVRSTKDAPLPRHRRMWEALRVGANTQYAVTMGLVPLSMLLFAQVSIVSPLANAVAIPLVSLVVTPLSLVGSVLPMALAIPVLELAHFIVQLLAACLQWFSGLPFAVWTAPTPPFWLFCWALAGTIWMLAPRGWPVRWLGLATWIPLLAATPTHPRAGAMRVTAFDVGQGMALLIETSGHRLLYDTGPLYSDVSNGGNRVILPYLGARGIAALDGMIVTHSDSDHSGGALAVLAALPVGWLLSSLPPDHAIVRAARQHRHCAAGQGWEWDGVRFEMLHPLPASYADPALKPNARGCTLKITAAGRSLLLAADIEAPQEAALLQRAGAVLGADVLLAPHHVIFSVFRCLKCLDLDRLFAVCLLRNLIVLYSSPVSSVSHGLIERLLF